VSVRECVGVRESMRECVCFPDDTQRVPNFDFNKIFKPFSGEADSNLPQERVESRSYLKLLRIFLRQGGHVACVTWRLSTLDFVVVICSYAFAVLLHFSLTSSEL